MYILFGRRGRRVGLLSGGFTRNERWSLAALTLINRPQPSHRTHYPKIAPRYVGGSTIQVRLGFHAYTTLDGIFCEVWVLWIAQKLLYGRAECHQRVNAREGVQEVMYD